MLRYHVFLGRGVLALRIKEGGEFNVDLSESERKKASERASKREGGRGGGRERETSPFGLKKVASSMWIFRNDFVRHTEFWIAHRSPCTGARVSGARERQGERERGGGGERERDTQREREA